MICPYCDSLIRELPDNRTCPQCGAPLAASFTEEQKNQNYAHTAKEKESTLDICFPEPPVGVYKDVAGYLELTEDSVVFLRRQFIRGHKRVIPYSDIYAVTYQPGVTLNCGFLCVREWKDRNIPLPSVTAEAAVDETAVYFVKAKNERFRHVYAFLKECADIVSLTRK